MGLGSACVYRDVFIEMLMKGWAWALPVFLLGKSHNSISPILKKHKTFLKCGGLSLCDLQILDIKDSMGLLHMGIHNNILELLWTFHLIS